jgi:tetratricopeptide (TPR) repeat protein
VDKLSPSDSNILNNRCYTLALLGRAQEALVDCNQSLERRARVPATLDSRGFVNLLLEKYADAIADYDAAMRGRRTANSLYGRGIAKIRSGKEAEGRADIAEAMKLDQNITARMAGFGFAP